METESTTVISVGADPELLWLRNFVLQSAGFNVITTTDHKDALARIERGECGVLLVCDSLAKPVRQRLAEALRRFCPGARMILIADEPIEKPDFADTFVYGLEGPELLIEAIRGAMSAKA
jgi:CheY-like chemotaxis protein